MELEMTKQTGRVRELNDDFRRDIFNTDLGELFLTESVSAMQDKDVRALISKVSCFEDFNEDNDPYGEHDFGNVNFQGEEYFFKIDYYDKSKQFLSPDPADPALTARVLTVMHSSEY
jgi:hypothetical protein